MLAGAVLGPVGALAGAIGGAIAGSRAGAAASEGRACSASLLTYACLRMHECDGDGSHSAVLSEPDPGICDAPALQHVVSVVPAMLLDASGFSEAAEAVDSTGTQICSACKAGLFVWKHRMWYRSVAGIL